MARVLIVDDEPDVRELFNITLKMAGHSTETSKDGMEAVDRLAKGDIPDLILLDLMMPRLDGYGLLNHIRTTMDAQPVRVLVATAKVLEDADNQKLSSWPVVGVLNKGELDISAMVTVISTALSKEPLKPKPEGETVAAPAAATPPAQPTGTPMPPPPASTPPASPAATGTPPAPAPASTSAAAPESTPPAAPTSTPPAEAASTPPASPAATGTPPAHASASTPAAAPESTPPAAPTSTPPAEAASTPPAAPASTPPSTPAAGTPPAAPSGDDKPKDAVAVTTPPPASGDKPDEKK